MQDKKQLYIQGPVGQIEAVLSIPEQHQNKLFVMCHPHPLYQGTMDNKVVTTLTNAMNDLGFISLRFNYRGVGKSEGEYGKALGEIDDTLAVINYLKSQFKDATTLVLGGFSFGGLVAYQAALKAHPNALILVSPAIAKVSTENNLDLDLSLEPDCPMLVIQGDQDDVIPKESVYVWLKTRKNQYSIKEIHGASHFFHGKLPELRQLSQDFIKEVLS